MDLLGRLPANRGAVASRLQGREAHSGYELEKLSLDLNGIEPVPAYFVRPAGSAGKRLPAVLFNHSHGGIYEIGKEELLQGKGYLQFPCYAEFLASLGYAVLCIDAWGVRRAAYPIGKRDLQTDVLERPCHVGNDGLRQHAGARLFIRAG